MEQTWKPTIEHATTCGFMDFPVHGHRMPVAQPPDGDGWIPNGGSATVSERYEKIELSEEVQKWLGSGAQQTVVPGLLFVWFWWRKLPYP